MLSKGVSIGIVGSVAAVMFYYANRLGLVEDCIAAISDIFKKIQCELGNSTKMERSICLVEHHCSLYPCDEKIWQAIAFAKNIALQKKK